MLHTFILYCSSIVHLSLSLTKKEDENVHMPSVYSLWFQQSYVFLNKIAGLSSRETSSRRSSFSLPLTPRGEGDILEFSNLKIFGFNDLRTATRNFRPDSVLGEGGFGCVFKGWIDENTFKATKPGTGMVIAVKRLNQEGLQGHREWLVSIEAFI